MSLMIEEYNLLTKNPIIEIIIPAILAIYSPFECGFMLLIGALVSGFMLAIFMANAHGDNMYVKSKICLKPIAMTLIVYVKYMRNRV